MKPLVIYHANCADGFGAAFAAWLKLGDEAEYLPMKYNEDLLGQGLLTVPRDVYILDFNFPKHTLESIIGYAKRVVWLDHHKSAFEMYGMLLNTCKEDAVDAIDIGLNYSTPHHVLLDNNKSGATLAWEYFHPDKEVPMLIKHIDDYDRWQFKIKGTKEFNKALWSYAPWNFEAWKEVLYLTEKEEWINASADPQLGKGYMNVLIEGAAILRAHEANVQAVVEVASRKCRITTPLNAVPCVSSGPSPWCTTYHYKEKVSDGFWWANGIAANCPPHLASDVGHALATQSGTYGLLWFIDKEGKGICSLRSNGDYDVSAIAKAFGGGGHKNAAGFEVDATTLLEWIK